MINQKNTIDNNKRDINASKVLLISTRLIQYAMIPFLKPVCNYKCKSRIPSLHLKGVAAKDFAVIHAPFNSIIWVKLFSRAAGLFLCVLIMGFSQQAAAEKLPQWELGVGLAGLSLPDYRGSDEVRSYLLPLPYFIYRLEWLKADSKGVRSTLFHSERVEANLSLNASPPVRSRSNRAREGMNDLKPIVEFGPSLNMHLWRSNSGRIKLDLRLPVRAAFTADLHLHQVGVNFSPHLNVDIAGIAGQTWRLGILAGPIFGSSRHHQYFYGVPEKNARADRPAYNARGGYAGTQFLMALSRRFSKTWFGAYTRYDTLNGAVFEESPLVRRKYAVSAGFAISWILGQSSTLVERED